VHTFPALYWLGDGIRWSPSEGQRSLESHIAGKQPKGQHGRSQRIFRRLNGDCQAPSFVRLAEGGLLADGRQGRVNAAALPRRRSIGPGTVHSAPCSLVSPQVAPVWEAAAHLSLEALNGVNGTVSQAQGGRWRASIHPRAGDDPPASVPPRRRGQPPRTSAPRKHSEASRQSAPKGQLTASPEKPMEEIFPATQERRHGWAARRAAGNQVGDVEAGSSKPWDQPLSTEDMRNRASNWSLADDSQLLAYLECVSRNITSRSYEIQKELDSLIHETRRVYDEEAKEPEKAQSEAQAESKEQQEAELVRRMRDAFQHGVQVVRSSLEFVDLHQEGDSDEDSEDEGAPSAEPLFRSRDPYLHRALPLLIGSQAFVQDDKVGLGDLLSEDEEEEEEKSSRGEYESDRSESDFDEEKEAKAPADTRMAQAMLREYGNHVESSEEELFNQKAELHSASSESEPDSDGDLLPKRGSVSSRRSEGAGSVRRREEDLFGVPSDGEMFAEAEEQSPFKKRGGAFSSPRKLFDDDEEDEKGDLFSDVPPTKERAPSTTTRPTPQFTQSGKKLPAGARSMLGGSGPPPLMRSESKPSEVKENAVRAQAAAVPKLPPRASSTDEEVFSDHSDEENGLFKDAPKVVQRQQSEREERPAQSSSGLFDTQASKAVPAPAKPAHKTFSAGGLFDEEEEDDLWAPAKKEPSSLHNSVKTETSAKEPPPPVKDEETLQVTQVSKPGGLFEDDDDLLFVPDRDSQKVQTKPETKLAKSFLFDDSEDIFSSAVPAPGGPGIAEPRPSSSEGGTSEGAEAEPFLAKGRAASRGLFLFEDDVPAEEVQTKEEPEPVPAATRKPTRESISLFDEEEADEDLFADRTPPTHMADSQSSHSIQSSSWSTGSKGDAEPASVRGEAASEQVGKARSGSRFLFEREDELFGGVTDEDVDLFAPTESGQPTTDSSSQKKPVGGVSLFGGSTLFGDELKHRLGRVGGVLEEPEADILDDGSGDLFAA
ncbi:hypothetical protein HPB47_006271, partial [Ixodes persulcatus]